MIEVIQKGPEHWIVRHRINVPAESEGETNFYGPDAEVRARQWAAAQDYCLDCWAEGKTPNFKIQ